MRRGAAPLLAGSATFAYDHTAAGSLGQRISISNLEDFRLVRRHSVTYALSGIGLRPLPY